MFKKILQSIPKNRFLAYLLILGLVPMGLVYFHYHSQKQELLQLGDQLSKVQRTSTLKQKKEATNQIVFNHYKDADHFFIDNKLENLPLLQREFNALQKITKSDSYTGNDYIEKRLHFLKNENHLSFVEGSRQSQDKIQEIVEVLAHPVELDTEDLLELLCLIEEKAIGNHQFFPKTPQLLITEFSLNKKKLPDTNEVLSLNMKLLKREYL